MHETWPIRILCAAFVIHSQPRLESATLGEGFQGAGVDLPGSKVSQLSAMASCETVRAGPLDHSNPFPILTPTDVFFIRIQQRAVRSFFHS